MSNIPKVISCYFSRNEQAKIYGKFKELKTAAAKKLWVSKYCSTGDHEQMIYHLPRIHKTGIGTNPTLFCWFFIIKNHCKKVL